MVLGNAKGESHMALKTLMAKSFAQFTLSEQSKTLRTFRTTANARKMTELWLLSATS